MGGMPALLANQSGSGMAGKLFLRAAAATLRINWNLTLIFLLIFLARVKVGHHRVVLVRQKLFDKRDGAPATQVKVVLVRNSQISIGVFDVGRHIFIEFDLVRNVMNRASLTVDEGSFSIGPLKLANSNASSSSENLTVAMTIGEWLEVWVYRFPRSGAILTCGSL